LFYILYINIISLSAFCLSSVYLQLLEGVFTPRADQRPLWKRTKTTCILSCGVRSECWAAHW